MAKLGTKRSDIETETDKIDMPKKIEFSNEEKEEIIRIYRDENISSKALGKRFNTSEAVMLRRLNEWNIKIADYRCHQFSDDDVARMVRLHQQEKMTQKEIGVLFGCSPATVKRHLKKAGVNTHRSRRLRFKNKKERLIVDRYKGGESAQSIADDIGCSEGAIRTVLSKNNIETRPVGSYRTYNVDDGAFDQINEYSAYFSGLIAADGNLLSTGVNHKKVSISSKDIDVLNKFREFLGNTNIPITINKRDVGSICISSARIYNNLDSWGITERKAHTLTITNDKLLNNRHFWRGFIDGDGSFRVQGPYGSSGPRLIMCLAVSSKQVIVDWIHFLLNNGLHANSITRTRKLYRVSYSNTPAQRIGRLLYLDASVYMNRKYKVAKDWGILQ